MKHTEYFTTNFHDTDASRLLRPSSVVRYMQETANLHCNKLGLPVNKLRDETKVAFILSRIAVKIYHPLSFYQNIESSTWTSESKGFVLGRCFQIKKDGVIVAEGISAWALVNLNTMKPDRYEHYDFPFEDEEPLSIDAPLRFRFPSVDGAELVGTRKIMYSDIDFNMHMNNTHYPDMFCDYIPDMEKKTVSEISISYVHEAHFGALADIYRVNDPEDPDVYYLRLCESGSSPKNGWVDARIRTINV